MIQPDTKTNQCWLNRSNELTGTSLAMDHVPRDKLMDINEQSTGFVDSKLHFELFKSSHVFPEGLNESSTSCESLKNPTKQARSKKKRKREIEKNKRNSDFQSILDSGSRSYRSRRNNSHKNGSESFRSNRDKHHDRRSKVDDEHTDVFSPSVVNDAELTRQGTLSSSYWSETEKDVRKSSNSSMDSISDLENRLSPPSVDQFSQSSTRKNQSISSIPVPVNYWSETEKQFRTCLAYSLDNWSESENKGSNASISLADKNNGQLKRKPSFTSLLTACSEPEKRNKKCHSNPKSTTSNNPKSLKISPSTVSQSIHCKQRSTLSSPDQSLSVKKNLISFPIQSQESERRLVDQALPKEKMDNDYHSIGPSQSFIDLSNREANINGNFSPSHVNQPNLSPELTESFKINSKIPASCNEQKLNRRCEVRLDAKMVHQFQESLKSRTYIINNKTESKLSLKDINCYDNFINRNRLSSNSTAAIDIDNVRLKKPISATIDHTISKISKKYKNKKKISADNNSYVDVHYSSELLKNEAVGIIFSKKRKVVSPAGSNKTDFESPTFTNSEVSTGKRHDLHSIGRSKEKSPIPLSLKEKIIDCNKICNSNPKKNAENVSYLPPDKERSVYVSKLAFRSSDPKKLVVNITRSRLTYDQQIESVLPAKKRNAASFTKISKNISSIFLEEGNLNTSDGKPISSTTAVLKTESCVGSNSSSYSTRDMGSVTSQCSPKRMKLEINDTKMAKRNLFPTVIKDLKSDNHSNYKLTDLPHSKTINGVTPPSEIDIETSQNKKLLSLSDPLISKDKTAIYLTEKLNFSTNELQREKRHRSMTSLHVDMNDNNYNKDDSTVIDRKIQYEISTISKASDLAVASTLKNKDGSKIIEHKTEPSESFSDDTEEATTKFPENNLNNRYPKLSSRESPEQYSVRSSKLINDRCVAQCIKNRSKQYFDSRLEKNISSLQESLLNSYTDQISKNVAKLAYERNAESSTKKFKKFSIKPSSTIYLRTYSDIAFHDSPEQPSTISSFKSSPVSQFECLSPPHSLECSKMGSKFSPDPLFEDFPEFSSKSNVDPISDIFSKQSTNVSCESPEVIPKLLSDTHLETSCNIHPMTSSEISKDQSSAILSSSSYDACFQPSSDISSDLSPYSSSDLSPESFSNISPKSSNNSPQSSYKSSESTSKSPESPFNVSQNSFIDKFSKSSSVVLHESADISSKLSSDVPTKLASDVLPKFASAVLLESHSALLSEPPSAVFLKQSVSTGVPSHASSSGVSVNPHYNVSPEPLSDVSPEAPSDVSPEAPSDVSPEAPSDVSSEVPSDVSSETPSDVSPEAPSDASPEAPSDASPEALSDASPEAPSDVSSEAPSDISLVGSSVISPERPSDTSPESHSDIGPEPLSDVSPEPPSHIYPESPSDAYPESASYSSPEPLSDISLEPATNITSKPPSVISPEPDSDISPEPASDISPEPPSDLCPDPPSDLSPEPSSDLYPEPPSDLCPDPSSDLSPEPPFDLSPEPPYDLSPEPPSDISLELRSNVLPRPSFYRPIIKPTDASTEAPVRISIELCSDIGLESSVVSAKRNYDLSNELISDISNELISGVSNELIFYISNELLSDKSNELISDMSHEVSTNLSLESSSYLSFEPSISLEQLANDREKEKGIHFCSRPSTALDFQHCSEKINGSHKISPADISSNPLSLEPLSEISPKTCIKIPLKCSSKLSGTQSGSADILLQNSSEALSVKSPEVTLTQSPDISSQLVSLKGLSRKQKDQPCVKSDTSCKRSSEITKESLKVRSSPLSSPPESSEIIRESSYQMSPNIVNDLSTRTQELTSISSSDLPAKRFLLTSIGISDTFDRSSSIIHQHRASIKLRVQPNTSVESQNQIIKSIPKANSSNSSKLCPHSEKFINAERFSVLHGESPISHERLSDSYLSSSTHVKNYLKPLVTNQSPNSLKSQCSPVLIENVSSSKSSNENEPRPAIPIPEILLSTSSQGESSVKYTLGRETSIKLAPKIQSSPIVPIISESYSKTDTSKNYSRIIYHDIEGKLVEPRVHDSTENINNLKSSKIVHSLSNGYEPLTKKRRLLYSTDNKDNSEKQHIIMNLYRDDPERNLKPSSVIEPKDFNKQHIDKRKLLDINTTIEEDGTHSGAANQSFNMVVNEVQDCISENKKLLQEKKVESESRDILAVACLEVGLDEENVRNMSNDEEILSTEFINKYPILQAANDSLESNRLYSEYYKNYPQDNRQHLNIPQNKFLPTFLTSANHVEYDKYYSQFRSVEYSPGLPTQAIYSQHQYPSYEARNFSTPHVHYSEGNAMKVNNYHPNFMHNDPHYNNYKMYNQNSSVNPYYSAYKFSGNCQHLPYIDKQIKHPHPYFKNHNVLNMSKDASNWHQETAPTSNKVSHPIGYAQTQLPHHPQIRTFRPPRGSPTAATTHNHNEFSPIRSPISPTTLQRPLVNPHRVLTDKSKIISPPRNQQPCREGSNDIQQSYPSPRISLPSYQSCLKKKMNESSQYSQFPMPSQYRGMNGHSEESIRSHYYHHANPGIKIANQSTNLSQSSHKRIQPPTMVLHKNYPKKSNQPLTAAKSSRLSCSDGPFPIEKIKQFESPFPNTQWQSHRNSCDVKFPARQMENSNQVPNLPPSYNYNKSHCFNEQIDQRSRIFEKKDIVSQEISLQRRSSLGNSPMPIHNSYYPPAKQTEYLKASNSIYDCNMFQENHVFAQPRTNKHSSVIVNHNESPQLINNSYKSCNSNPHLAVANLRKSYQCYPNVPTSLSSILEQDTLPSCRYQDPLTPTSLPTCQLMSPPSESVMSIANTKTSTPTTDKSRRCSEVSSVIPTSIEDRNYQNNNDSYYQKQRQPQLPSQFSDKLYHRSHSSSSLCEKQQNSSNKEQLASHSYSDLAIGPFILNKGFATYSIYDTEEGILIFKQKLLPVIDHLLSIPEAANLRPYRDNPDELLGHLVQLWGGSEANSKLEEPYARMKENFLSVVKYLFDPARLVAWGWDKAAPEQILDELLKPSEIDDGCDGKLIRSKFAFAKFVPGSSLASRPAPPANRGIDEHDQFYTHVDMLDCLLSPTGDGAKLNPVVASRDPFELPVNGTAKVTTVEPTRSSCVYANAVVHPKNFLLSGPPKVESVPSCNLSKTILPYVSSEEIEPGPFKNGSEDPFLSKKSCQLIQDFEPATATKSSLDESRSPLYLSPIPLSYSTNESECLAAMSIDDVFDKITSVSIFKVDKAVAEVRDCDDPEGTTEDQLEDEVFDSCIIRKAEPSSLSKSGVAIVEKEKCQPNGDHKNRRDERINFDWNDLTTHLVQYKEKNRKKLQTSLETRSDSNKSQTSNISTNADTESSSPVHDTPEDLKSAMSSSCLASKSSPSPSTTVTMVSSTKSNLLSKYKPTKTKHKKFQLEPTRNYNEIFQNYVEKTVLAEKNAIQ